jgi:hypothetical protein
LKGCMGRRDLKITTSGSPALFSKPLPIQGSI